MYTLITIYVYFSYDLCIPWLRFMYTQITIYVYLDYDLNGKHLSSNRVTRTDINKTYLLKR